MIKVGSQLKRRYDIQLSDTDSLYARILKVIIDAATECFIQYY